MPRHSSLRSQDGRPRRLPQHERPFSEDAVTDRVESLVLTRHQLVDALELQSVNRIARLRLDERQRDHPVEEEMVRVPARATGNACEAGAGGAVATAGSR